MARRDYYVLLESWEFELGEKIGLYRHKKAIEAGKKDQHGASKEKGEAYHKLGGVGEVVLLKFWGLWKEVNGQRVYAELQEGTYKRGDVGENVQVRTRSHSDYELQVRDSDNKNHYFILVVKGRQGWIVRGWIKGTEVLNHPEWRHNYGGREPAWFVPNDFLHDMMDFPVNDIKNIEWNKNGPIVKDVAVIV